MRADFKYESILAMHRGDFDSLVQETEGFELKVRNYKHT